MAAVQPAAAHVGGHHGHEGEPQYVWTAVSLSIVSGMAATVGGLVVIWGGVPSKPVLGHLLSFSAGVMMYISYADLLAHASQGSGTAAAAWMFVGMLGFWAVGALLPEPELPVAEASADKLRTGELRVALRAAEADDSGDRAQLVERLDALRAADGGGSGGKAGSSKMLMTGVIACIAISLHNLPEGLIVYTQTLSGVCKTPWGGWEAGPLAGYLRGCLGRGVAISVAMALHNIPEGMAVAAPVLAATGSRWEAFKWCVLSSIVEPLGAIVLGLAFRGSLAGPLQEVLEAVVGGIMVMLCIMELLPTAAELAGPKAAALSNLAGQAVICWGLWLVSGG
ncbi:hypothetical protein FNF28_05840 [Cafeteria roenbergensis]|uniref:Uncharacterized protein n=2 Tax=Cafeteria roenbergensis TaxID=33653 RepID=A0A5A8D250_CAFRO|nr:hypothetical protein FNF28_05840 [Cafeteria roenbergensis]